MHQENSNKIHVENLTVADQGLIDRIWHHYLAHSRQISCVY
jgi:hypothetical protein